MAVSILYLLSFSYKSVRFEFFKEADTVINELKKLKQKAQTSALGTKNVRKTQLMKIKNSTWPLFGYYIHKMKQKPLWKTIFYPDLNTPSILTLIFESLLLNLPFLVLCAETFNANNYNWAVVYSFVVLLYLTESGTESQEHTDSTSDIESGIENQENTAGTSDIGNSLNLQNRKQTKKTDCSITISNECSESGTESQEHTDSTSDIGKS
ncbi:uncharacterized protein LOC131938179 [Physella acuta]|uniref:uncharacterized protein LOC131938179 n=1 Tax=Physella acuta TaxID=109671 RepID=UPI0027DAE3A7|nr:uncharacterized protein LOC131938179 [Physella acuta]